MALPRCAQSTISWISTRDAVLSSPMPKPMTSEPTPARTGEDSGVEEQERRPRRPAAAGCPASSTGRRPKRTSALAASVAPIGQPSTSMVSAKPATSGGLLQHALHIHGQEGGQADHRHAGQQRRAVGGRDGPPAPEPECHHRVRGAALLPQEQRAAEPGAATAADAALLVSEVPNSVRATISDATDTVNRVAPAKSMERRSMHDALVQEQHEAGRRQRGRAAR